MTSPTELEMRKQTLSTMAALEKMANAVTDHLTADKQPAEQNECTDADAPCACRRTARVFDEDVVFERDVVIRGDVVIEGTSTLVASKSVPPAFEPGELEHIRDLVVKHHKALALIAAFGRFKDGPVLGPDPADELRHLLGMKACEECVGTGRLARDETCDACKLTGYIKS